MPRPSVVFALASAALLGSAAPARADNLAMQCAGAAERAQTLRDAAKLVEAREQLLVCARDECPRAVVHDCLGWMREVEQNLPTVVFGARDARGVDVTDVRVRVDGALRAERLDGTAIAVDPGEHTFRFERPGAAPIDLQALVHEGEKNRLVSAQWPASAAVDSAEVPSIASRRTAWPWILGGAGVVAAGVGVWGIASGLSEHSTLQTTCGRTATGCTGAAIDAARTKLWVGDVAAGVAVVALGAAAWLFVSETTRVGVAVQSGGPFVEVVRGF